MKTKFAIHSLEALPELINEPFATAGIGYDLALKLIQQYGTGKRFRVGLAQKTKYEIEVNGSLYIVYLYDSGVSEVRLGSDL